MGNSRLGNMLNSLAVSSVILVCMHQATQILRNLVSTLRRYWQRKLRTNDYIQGRTSVQEPRADLAMLHILVQQSERPPDDTYLSSSAWEEDRHL